MAKLEPVTTVRFDPVQLALFKGMIKRLAKRVARERTIRRKHKQHFPSVEARS